jgi:antirestriction protein ArdC
MPRPAPVHKSFTDRNSLYQQITDKIIAELEQGRLPWTQPCGHAGPRSTCRAMPPPAEIIRASIS